jgi:hypothetical protein
LSDIFTFYASTILGSTGVRIKAKQKKATAIRGGLRAAGRKLQAFFQHRGRLESDGAARLDVDNRSGLRVTSLARFARTDGEGSEPGYLEPFAFSDRFPDLIECRIDCGCGGNFADSCTLRNGLD